MAEEEFIPDQLDQPAPETPVIVNIDLDTPSGNRDFV